MKRFLKILKWTVLGIVGSLIALSVIGWLMMTPEQKAELAAKQAAEAAERTAKQEAERAAIVAKKEAEKAEKARLEQLEKERKELEAGVKLLETTTIADYKERAKNKEEAQKNVVLVKAYILNQNTLKVPEDLTGMQKCLSWKVAERKMQSIKVKDMLDWCEGEKRNMPDTYQSYVDPSLFLSQISAWDHSYYPLEKLLKNNAHNPDSFKVRNASYVLNKPNSARVQMRFSGTNKFGGVVTQSVVVDVDLATLKMTEVSR